MGYTIDHALANYYSDCLWTIHDNDYSKLDLIWLQLYSTDPKIIEKIKIEEILLFKLNVPVCTFKLLYVENSPRLARMLFSTHVGRNSSSPSSTNSDIGLTLI